MTSHAHQIAGGPVTQQAATALTASPIEDYQQQAGDLWILNVSAEPGVPVSAPPAWFPIGEPTQWWSDQLQAQVTVRQFGRIVGGNDPLPTVSFARAALAAVQLSAARPGAEQ